MNGPDPQHWSQKTTPFGRKDVKIPSGPGGNGTLTIPPPPQNVMTDINVSVKIVPTLLFGSTAPTNREKIQNNVRAVRDIQTRLYVRRMSIVMEPLLYVKHLMACAWILSKIQKILVITP